MCGDRTARAVEATFPDPSDEVVDGCRLRVERDGGGLADGVELDCDDTGMSTEDRLDPGRLRRPVETPRLEYDLVDRPRGVSPGVAVSVSAVGHASPVRRDRCGAPCACFAS